LIIRCAALGKSIACELGDLQMLDAVLIVISSAFGRSFDAFDGAILQGVALVLGHYSADELDTDRLVAQLRDIPPRQPPATALALREAHRGTLPRLSAAVITDLYNAGRGRNAEPFAIALAGGPKRVITLSDPAAADFGVTLSEPTPDRAPGALDETIALLADGRLRLRAHQSMPMQQAAEAHRHLESGNVHERIILTLE
jgi:hypothetical protein